MCSLDLEPFEPCTPARHLHGPAQSANALSVVATDLSHRVAEMEAAIYEWEEPQPSDRHPAAETCSIERRRLGPSSTIVSSSAPTT